MLLACVGIKQTTLVVAQSMGPVTGHFVLEPYIPQSHPLRKQNLELRSDSLDINVRAY